ncbi:MAG: hypothetical protein IKE58_00815 [Blautia sp.]|nr:hypothetical protein [Blautia sp.]
MDIKNVRSTDAERSARNQEALRAAADPGQREIFLADHRTHILRIASLLTNTSVTTGDEEWFISLRAVSEALEHYQEGKGYFWTYAVLAVKSRLNDWYTVTSRQLPELSLLPQDGEVKAEEDKGKGIPAEPEPSAEDQPRQDEPKSSRGSRRKGKSAGEKTGTTKGKKNGSLIKRLIIGLVACLVLAGGAIGTYFAVMTPASTVTLDGQASFMFRLNTLDQVMTVEGYNEESQELAKELSSSIKGKRIPVALTSTLEHLAEKDLLSKEYDETIVITIDAKPNKKEKLENAISEHMDEWNEKRSIETSSGMIWPEFAAQTEEMKEKAMEQGVSPGQIYIKDNNIATGPMVMEMTDDLSDIEDISDFEDINSSEDWDAFFSSYGDDTEGVFGEGDFMIDDPALFFNDVEDGGSGVPGRTEGGSEEALAADGQGGGDTGMSDGALASPDSDMATEGSEAIDPTAAEGASDGSVPLLTDSSMPGYDDSGAIDIIS